MNILLSIIFSLIVLGVLITVHEAGHYGAGRLLGFNILEFSIGMGPKIFKREKNGILYTIRLLPIGGMCRFYGEDEEISDGKCFNAHPVWKRAIVVAAGAFMNFVIAILLVITLIGIFGGTKQLVYQMPVIAGLEDGSAGEAAGLQAGDIVAYVNNKEVHSSEEMINLIRSSENGTVMLTVIRPNEDTVFFVDDVALTPETDLSALVSNKNEDIIPVTVNHSGSYMDITIVDIYDEEVGYNRIGAMVTMTLQNVSVRYGVLRVFSESFRYIGNTLSEMVKFLGSLFTGKATVNDMAGIVGIVDTVSSDVGVMIESEVSTGSVIANIAGYLLSLAALLSINLGLINILPLPALDGGRLVFMGIEAIFRKPVPQKIEGMVHFVGLILLLALMAFVTLNDVIRAVAG